MEVGTGKAMAADLADGRIEIHGYGNTDLLLSKHNRFLGSDSSGIFDSALALLVAAKVTDKTTIWTQVFGNKDKIRLDWAFVDFKVSEDFDVRAGQIKTPIGIYNEIRDVKYLQLSTLAPYLYQEAADIVDEAFTGASIVYKHDMAGGDLGVDLYGGKMVAFGDDPATHNHMFGGRLTYRTPLEGLRMMASGFTADAKVDDASGRANLLVGSIDYLNYGVDLKGEYAHIEMIDERKDAYYAQAGYTFFEKLTPFVRYDYITTDKNNRSDPSFYQKGFVVGAGYKINDNVSVKVEDHFIKGYALPVASGEIVAGEGSKEWNLFAAGINFMF